MYNPFEPTFIVDGSTLTSVIPPVFPLDVLRIPEKVDGKEIRAIGFGALSQARKVYKTIYFDDGIEDVGLSFNYICGFRNACDAAYKGKECSIDRIRWPVSCTEIPNMYFANFANAFALDNIQNVTKIGYNAFSNCRIREPLRWPDRCSEIPQNCFFLSVSHFNDEQKLEITNLQGVRTVKDSAFKGAAINEIEFGPALETIEDEAFTDSLVSSIKGIENVSFIGRDAFSYTSELRSFKYPEKCCEIPERCFKKSALQFIDLSLSPITFIGDEAFAFSELDDVVMPYYAYCESESAFLSTPYKAKEGGNDLCLPKKRWR